MSKRKLLKELAMRRQQAAIDRFRGCAHIGGFHGGIYDCDHVSPWTKSADNPDAEVMIVGQDWASTEMLSGPLHPERVRLGYDPERSTNQALQRLLRDHLNLAFGETYATNAFPFVKPGPANAPVPAGWMDFGVREFLLPQIAIIKPRLVICLGTAVITSVRRTLRLPRLALTEAIASPVQHGVATVFGAAHTGRLGMNNRGRDQVERDWAKMALFLRRPNRAA